MEWFVVGEKGEIGVWVVVFICVVGSKVVREDWQVSWNRNDFEEPLATFFHDSFYNGILLTKFHSSSDPKHHQFLP